MDSGHSAVRPGNLAVVWMRALKLESDDCQFEVDTIFDWQPVQPCKNRCDVFMSMLTGEF